MPWRVCVWIAASLVLGAVGTSLVRELVAVPATIWMHMYSPDQFATFADLIAFVRDLRVPIPPAIAAFEILSVQHTGSVDLVTKDFYHVSLVGSYVIAVWLTYPSWLRLAAAVVVSSIFLWATTLMHPLNAQVYDVVLPLFLLAFVLLLRTAEQLTRYPKTATLISAAAGLCLALTELSRPFVFLALPVLLAGAYVCLRACPRQTFVALLIPVGLLTGLWHLHLYAAHGQVLATNYAGFNMRRAWPQPPLPAGMHETSTNASAEQSWPNINTKEQYVAAQLLQSAVLRYAVTHPLEALQHAAGRVVLFARPQTTMYGSLEPQHPLIAVYKVAVPTAVLFMFANLVVLGAYAIGARSRCLYLLAHPTNLLLLFTAFTFVVLSLGEANEEARLIVTVLPLLAAIPVATPDAGDRTPPRSSA